MKNKCFIFIITILIILCWNSQSLSLEEKTHEEINKHIAQNTVSGFSLNDYLKNNLGFKKGIEEALTGIDAGGTTKNKEVFWWIGYGGEQEDRPGSKEDYINRRPTRSVNHFHNPRKTDWNDAGLKDKIPILGWYTGQSSILWAQNPNQYIGGKWSWQDAREYYYIALTGKNFKNEDVAKKQEDKEKSFAKTFRAVGQQMHLIEDASVPQHVRNDIHITPWHYEHFVENVRLNKDNKYPTKWENWIKIPISFNKSILDMSSGSSNAPVPITRIIDTNKYEVTNPDPGITTISNAIGIAEYANANFLSEDTMFTDDLPIDHWHYFPYPRRKGATLWFDTSNLRPYFKKTGEGEPINHLATVGQIGLYRLKHFPQYYMYFPVALDDACRGDYAEKLIPRAVGYSAGLLNYFFRGTIEITPPAEYVYSITDGSVVPQQFTTIKAKLKNTSIKDKDQNGNITYEEMKAGTLQAVAKYKKRKDYQPDLSTDPPISPESREDDFSYSVSASKDINSLSSSEPSPFTFDFKDDPIPAGITDLYLFVVFKGTLGNEKDIAVAVGMKNLLEPTHLDLWNLTDMFSLNYKLYTSEEIKDDPELLQYVDFDHDGEINTSDEIKEGELYIDPFKMDMQVSFHDGRDSSQPIPPLATIKELPAGRYFRLIVLIDKWVNNYYKLAVKDSEHIYDVIYGNDFIFLGNFTFNGAKNQEESDGIFYYTSPKTFRGIKRHGGKGILSCIPPLPDGTCYYPEDGSGAIPLIDPSSVKVTIHFE